MSTSSASPPSSLPPAPRGGAAPSWTADARSGFLVFLVALPLCLGIAMASGFPPIAGVLTAIVGGVGGTALRGAPLTIKGPAAGLIVIVLGAVQELGAGDPVLGYRRALAVGVIAAVLQIGLALVKAGRFALVMPPSVVHGMLAAIGVIIVAKQTPVLLGAPSPQGEPLHLLAALPDTVMHANPEVAALGLLAMGIMVAMALGAKRPLIQKVPAPLVVLAFTVPLAVALHFSEPHPYTFLDHTWKVGPELLVQLPGGLLQAITLPDFSALGEAATWKYVAMFAIVGSVESLLTVVAVDSLDPAKRSSDLDRDLLATGVSNLVSASLGGLPMISEIVRSKANLDAGATSARSNLVHGLLLLGFVALLPGLLELIPLAALAAMLVFTGLRLASWREFTHAWAVGRDQFALFFTTLVVTLATDLLLGVAAGLLLKLALHVARGAPLSGLFRRPFTVRRESARIVLELSGPGAFTNLLQLQAALRDLPPEITEVVVDLSGAPLVDHTFQEKLHRMADEWPHARLRLVGMDRLQPASAHPFAVRRRAA